MNPRLSQASQAIQNAHQALKRGDRQTAHRWAQRAAALAPHLEEPWLLLAAVSSPQTGIRYLQRALQINPLSPRARAGMDQLTSQLQSPARERTQPTRTVQTRTPKLARKPRRISLWLAVLALILAGAAIWGGASTAQAVFAPAATSVQGQSWSQVDVSKPTYTPSPTPTSTPTLTETPIPTPTLEMATPEPGPQAEPAVNYAPGATYIVQRGDTLGQIARRFNVAAEKIAGANNLTDPSSIYAGQELVIPGVDYIPPQPVPIGGPKRILVDISEQHLYAYEGNVLVYSFVASTGMNNATAVGNFSVLNKIPNAYGSTWNIWMPNWLGIYWAGGLQNGIHALPILPGGGRLWAGYLGTPISYGCVVLGEYESGLLYNWAEIGTPVVIQW